MKLPNAHLAVVDRRKVTDYLLDAEHPRNGGKAAFFKALGFSAEAPWRFIEAIRRLAMDATGDVVTCVESAHGEKYVVDGPLPGHTQESPAPSVRTVWMIRHGREVPELVTAYPRKK